MPDKHSDTPETDGEFFDCWLLEAEPSEFEEFLAEAPKFLKTKPMEFVRDCKARVDARIAAEPDKKVFSMSGPHEVRLLYWDKIAERFQAEINLRSIRPVQSVSAQPVEHSTRPGAQKDHVVAARRTIVRQNPGITDKELCQILDRKNIALPKGWPEAGLKTWSEAWCTRRRNIHVIFAKNRKPS
jgi:hypothetical protein